MPRARSVQLRVNPSWRSSAACLALGNNLVTGPRGHKRVIVRATPVTGPSPSLPLAVLSPSSAPPILPLYCPSLSDPPMASAASRRSGSTTSPSIVSPSFFPLPCSSRAVLLPPLVTTSLWITSRDRLLSRPTAPALHLFRLPTRFGCLLPLSRLPMHPPSHLPVLVLPSPATRRRWSPASRSHCRPPPRARVPPRDVA